MRFLILNLIVLFTAFGEDSRHILRVDHFVPVKSTVPSIMGQITPIYVREVVQAGIALRNTTSDKVVLFVHGAGTPAEVAFDVPHSNYSWMEFLANAGYDVFAMDMTGYGRSTRPALMNDPCNLAKEQQAAVTATPCPAADTRNLTTIASDWNDIGSVVDHLRSLRHVDKVNLIGWSLGGPRAGGYTAQNPAKVNKLILLSPAYGRGAVEASPAMQAASGAVMNTQSLEEFAANWDRQVGCAAQIDPDVAKVVWSEMLASDPVGATWGSGVRRAPLVTSRGGWDTAAAAKVLMPVLLFAPVHDKQVTPEGVRRLFDDLGTRQKVYADLACSSHNALWEKNHLLMFRASLEWLAKGSVNGNKEGTVKLGY